MSTSNIVKNFRDVGESLNELSGKAMFPEGVFYRGGRLNSVFDHGEILSIPTILNLRTGKDEELFECNYLHVPAEDKVENYNTGNGKVRKWVNKVISKICEENISFPIYVHCTSGKDRTGVITASVLKCFQVPDDLIIKEYLLSDGVEGARPIKQALAGFGDITQYLKGDTATTVVQRLSSGLALK